LFSRKQSWVVNSGDIGTSPGSRFQDAGRDAINLRDRLGGSGYLWLDPPQVDEN
jgi:hypothetical protein